ncbi:hypothetical protein [Acidisphaera sp. L21]|uniref:hypothetical protein n=1 Tax=Acidisphaera sp. L21 TaxID=1641851 RepID=UPI00131D5D45|nr:hypothetical protein [Acidisphaera sp. L21]
MDLFPSGKDEQSIDRNRLSFMRRNWRRAKFIAGSPVANVGFQEISEGRRFIGGLWGLLRRGIPTDTRLKSDEDGSIDLLATAFSYGMSVEALVERLRFRQGQTAWAAYAMFGLGSVFLVLWLYGALHIGMSSARLFSALEFLPFCTLFFLLAFKSAWLNWQLRTRRLGSPVAYLKTTEPFLPR